MVKEKKHKPYLMFNGYMKLAGITLKGLADQLNQQPRTVMNKINGQSDFSLSEGLLISNLFGKPLSDIFLT